MVVNYAFSPFLHPRPFGGRSGLAGTGPVGFRAGLRDGPLRAGLVLPEALGLPDRLHLQAGLDLLAGLELSLVGYLSVALVILLLIEAVMVWRMRRRQRSRSVETPAPSKHSVRLVPDAGPEDGVQGESDPLVLGLEPGGRSRGRRSLVAFAVLLAVGAGILTVLRTPLSNATPVRNLVLGIEDPAPAPERDAPGENGATAGDIAPEAIPDTVASVHPELGTRLIRWAGHDQTGQTGRPLRRALAVVLRDSTGRPMPGAAVRFSVAGGGGRVEPAIAETSDLGLATGVWWLGDRADSLRVVAYPVDSPELRVEFTAGLAGGAAPTEPEPVREVAQEDADPAPQGATGSSGEAAAGAAPAPPIPPPVAATLKPRASLSAGGVHTCRLEPSGGVGCWGADERTTTGPRGPADGAGSAPELRTVSAGVFHTCGLTNSGTVYCWPARRGAEQTAAAPAVEIELPDGSIPLDVVAGTEHSCALAANGRVYCWGANTHGQLGDGSTRDSSEPVRADGLTGTVQLATGWLHTCALNASGRAFCWGANAAGQIGDGRSQDRNVPTAVAHAAPFTEIVAGSAHTCALTDGRAWCWGSDQHGQLGTGGAEPRRQPTRVRGDVIFRSLTAGGVHTCGLDSDGRAWCWGRNTFGQLGNGGTDNAAVPTPVAGDHRFVTLQAGGAHTCGEATEGGLWCWGNNVQGQLGDGTRGDRPVPVRVNR